MQFRSKIRKKEKQKSEVSHKYKVRWATNTKWGEPQIQSWAFSKQNVFETQNQLILNNMTLPNQKKCLKAYKIHFKHRINTRTKKGVVGRYNGELWVWRHLWCGRNNCVVCVCLPSLRDVVWPCSEWIHYVNLHLVILHFVNFTFGPPYIWSTVTKRQLLRSSHYTWSVFLKLFN